MSSTTTTTTTTTTTATTATTLTSQDDDLIRGMASGDEACLAVLYDRHAPRLLALGVHVLRNHHEAEDVVHDVFMEAWNKAATFDPQRATVRGWLVMRMRSRCLDRARAAAVRRNAPEDAPPRPLPIAHADHISSAPDGERVRRALATLPTAQREALELVYFDGMSSAEAAEHLGCPTGTLKSRVRLAMNALRDQLGVVAGGVS